MRKIILLFVFSFVSMFSFAQTEQYSIKVLKYNLTNYGQFSQSSLSGTGEIVLLVSEKRIELYDILGEVGDFFNGISTFEIVRINNANLKSGATYITSDGFVFSINPRGKMVSVYKNTVPANQLSVVFIEAEMK